MLTWETTLRLVRAKAPSPILVGLVIEELEGEIGKLKLRRAQGNGHSLTSDEVVVLRGYLLKRFMLYKKLTEMIDGTTVEARRCVEGTPSTD